MICRTARPGGSPDTILAGRLTGACTQEQHPESMLKRRRLDMLANRGRFTCFCGGTPRNLAPAGRRKSMAPGDLV
jgi:hypothetical protein